MFSCRELYLDLLKKTLLFELWDETKLWRVAKLETHPFYKRWFVNAVVQHLAKTERRIMEPVPFSDSERQIGSDWPTLAHTMVGRKRLDHLLHCCETIIEEGVPGDFIETGVWRGGSCILMRGALKAHNAANRTVWVADSFEGLPPPDAEKYPLDEQDKLFSFDELRVTLDEVRDTFARYGLLDDQVQFLKGWFKDTLPHAAIKELALLRLDGDMYESTIDSLRFLYPKLAPGGYCIIDDYWLPACESAVQDYRREHNINEEIHSIDGFGFYWRRDSK